MSLAFLSHYDFAGEGDEQVARVRCPFHDDTNPSFWVYIDKADAHCYVCDWHGTIMDAVVQLENVKPLCALMLLSKWSKADGVDETARAISDLPVRDKVDHTASYRQLPMLVGSESEAEVYMWNRGFKDETLDFFDVRVDARSEWPIVFPILSWPSWEGYDACTHGREILGWQRRSLDNRSGKYKFSRGTKLSQIVAGWRSSGRDAMEYLDGQFKGGVGMTEGYFDMMKAWQHLGMTVAVCSPLTWLLRPQQAKQIDFETVVLALDNDERGREGATRAAMLLPNTINIIWESDAKDVCEIDDEVFQLEVHRALRRMRRIRKRGK
jgi:hypothetical protein